MVKEPYYKSRKGNEEFSKRKHMASLAKYNPLSAYGIARKIDTPSSSRGDSVEIREEKYTFGLASMDEKIRSGDLREAYFTFLNLQKRLDQEQIMPKDKVEKYQEALARRGSRLITKSNKSENYFEDNKVILKYCKKHLKKNKSSGLEKAITIISLGSMILGVAIGYPALTGNAIADVVSGSLIHGAALFFLGLLGVFLANKK